MNHSVDPIAPKIAQKCNSMQTKEIRTALSIQDATFHEKGARFCTWQHEANNGG